MGEAVPEWACAPTRKGWRLHISDVDGGGVLKRDADAKAGYLIGRNGQVCDFEVNHKSASRVHACLAFEADGTPCIVDLGSTHGTFVDGKRLEKSGKAELIPGKSTVTIGRYPAQFVLHLDSNGLKHDGHPEGVKGSKEAAAPAHAEGNATHVRKERHYRSRRGEEPAEGAEQGEQRHVADRGLESNGADRHRVEAERSARQNGAAAAAPPREAEGGRATRDRQHPPPRAEREGARPGAWRDVDARGDPSRGDPGRGARAGAWRDTGRGDPGRGDPGRDSRADVRDRGGPGPGSGRGHDRDGGARSDRAHARSPGRGEHHDRRDDRRPGRRPSRSPEPRRRRSAECGERDRGDRGGSAGGEGKRPRKTVFNSGGGAAGAAAAPQQTPAQIVMAMMGAGGAMPAGGALSLDQKKKLLWGKKAEPAQAAPVAEAFGANRWDTAQFADGSSKDKFIKLMGVKQVPSVPQQHEAEAAAPSSPSERAPLAGAKQMKVLHDIEGQFMAGLRRADGRTVGLGL